MKDYRIMWKATIYGDELLEAKSKKDALAKLKEMHNSDIDWDFTVYDIQLEDIEICSEA